jgi:hypothetical protein
MDESRKSLRIELDGRWSAEEMGRALTCLSELYNLRLFLELIRDEARELESYYFDRLERGDAAFLARQTRRFRRRFHPFDFGIFPSLPAIWIEREFVNLAGLVRPEESLDIRRINYASPGFADLTGIGTVVGHLKEFVLKLIERRDLKRQRELSDEKAELENERIRLENIKLYVALARDVGYSDTEVRQLANVVDGRQEILARLIDFQKIRKISSFEPSDSD